tara:strand:- start:1582 stop:3678 length:2097 start_codon:yes stop_codon:yes gene_type:complete
MSIIGTLRNKMGKFLVFVIGFSIASFVLGDILGPNSTLFGGNDTTIGTIKGEDIDFTSFQSLYEEFSYNFSLNSGTSPSPNDVLLLREQVWEKFIQDIAFQNEYDKLGVTVTSSELVEMVQGNNIHPVVRQAFTSPETGIFDSEQVVFFLKNLSNQSVEQQQFWSNFERNLIPLRLRDKYENLISKTNYVNKLESKREYINSNQSSSISYLYVPFYSISDSLVSVSDNELKSFLFNNKDDYKQEESRSLKYISFDVSPSIEDTLYVKEEMNNLKSLINQSSSDSIFSSINSDDLDYYISLREDEIKNLFGSNPNVGDIIDPQILNNQYVLYKLSEIIKEEKFSARAKHILLKWDDQSLNSKSEVRNEANRVLNLIRNGSDFDEMARMYSQDGSASNGGDLGWFTEGQMVDPFERAVFSKRSSGLINRVIETDFGFHIINVSSTKSDKIFKVSKIVKDIIPSDVTRNNSYRQAEIFRSENNSMNDFLSAADNLGLKISTNRINKNDQTVGSLQNSRSLIMWAYGVDDLGEISNVIELDNTYVIGILSEIKEEGTSELEDVEFSIRRKIINNKKFDFVNDKLSGIEGSLDEIAVSYGANANVFTMDNLLLSTSSLNNVGYSPNAIGVAFSMDEAERTKPFATDDGVLILQLNSKDTFSEQEDYLGFSSSLLEALNLASPLKIDKAIKGFSDISDYRYKFF